VEFSEHFVTAADGVRIYARHYAGPAAALTPVVCLPGLTRNSRDFEVIAPLLAPDRPVVALDFRGRGQSGWTEPATYRPDQEAADTLAVLDHLGIGRFAVIGTSRGGIVALFLAARAAPRLAGVLFNDIGPRIDIPGLLRIRSYLGSDRRYAGWDEAIAALKASNPGLETLSETEWAAFARRIYRTEDGQLRADYDPRLAQGFPPAAEIEAGKMPELWGLLDPLAQRPCLVLRGEHSDLLSEATVAAMHRPLKRLAAVTVAERGHVPFLDEPESLTAIRRWLRDVDQD
jgi:pimeloyl-ACP methyl ester carboxylesterase